ncbi:hypothetical protein HDK77DRAFT_501902, partial [Phyllosticta capitalensis]
SPLKTSRAFRAPFLFTSLTKPHAPPPHRLYSLLLYIMEATRSLSSRFPVNLPKKSKPTASTSALFKKSTQQLPPSINLHDARRKRDSRPTKYELTSKPHGIRKRVLKNNAMRTWEKAKLEKTQLSQRDSLSSMFSEATTGARKGVLTNAQALLDEAQSSLLARINSAYDDPSTTTAGSSPTKLKQPTPPAKAKIAKPSKGPFLSSSPEQEHEAANNADQTRPEPSSTELCRLHNAYIARLTRPLAEEKYRLAAVPESGVPVTITTLGDSMEEFRAIVAAEEKLIAELEAEWEGVTDEIRELGQTIQYGSLTEEEFAAGMRPTNGVDAAVIEALRREVVDVADEFEAGVREMKEAEKALKRRQERFLADTIRTMGEL